MFGRRYELFERKNGTIPELLVEFFETVGETEELNCVQDEWLFPAQYRKYTWMDDMYKDYFVLFGEYIELVEEDALYQEIYKQSKIAETENMEEVILFQLK